MAGTGIRDSAAVVLLLLMVLVAEASLLYIEGRPALPLLLALRRVDGVSTAVAHFALSRAGVQLVIFLFGIPRVRVPLT